MATEAEWRTSVLPFTLRMEGGLSKDHHDPGNWSGGKVGVGRLVGTKYGIAAASHPGVDIVNLTKDQAIEIYWREYVLARHFERLPLPLLLLAFDGGVNCGPVRAGRWMVDAQRESGIGAQIARFSALNLAYHKGLKTWGRYGKVWGPRIAACEKQALLLAAAAPVAVAAAHPAPAHHTPRAAPKAAHQPALGGWALFFRTLADALFQAPPSRKAPA